MPVAATSSGESLLLRNLSASAAARRTFGGSPTNHFRGPEGGDEFLHAVIVELDCSPLRIGFGYGPDPILLVSDRLPLFQDLHYFLSSGRKPARNAAVVHSPESM